MSDIDPRSPIEEDPAQPTPATAGGVQHKPWFRQRISGVGLGWPQTWQGWLIAIGIVVVIVVIGLAVKGRL